MAVLANCCAINIGFCDLSSFNVSVNSQSDGYICLNMVEKYVNICLNKAKREYHANIISE